MHVRIQVANSVRCGVELRPPDVSGSVNHLSLEIRYVDGIEVDEAERSNSSGCEVKGSRGSESARAHEKNSRTLEAALSFCAYLVENEMTSISSKLVTGQLGEICGLIHTAK